MTARAIPFSELVQKLTDTVARQRAFGDFGAGSLAGCDGEHSAVGGGVVGFADAVAFGCDPGVRGEGWSADSGAPRGQVPPIRQSRVVGKERCRQYRPTHRVLTAVVF